MYGGRKKIDWEVIVWVKEGVKCGVGEILLISMDFDGEKKGFDYRLIKFVFEIVFVFVIVLGGVGNV